MKRLYLTAALLTLTIVTPLATIVTHPVAAMAQANNPRATNPDGMFIDKLKSAVSSTERHK